MIEISGEVDHIEKDQLLAPGMPRPNQRTIPILRIRVLTPNGNLVQVLYKGDYLGSATLGHEVLVKGEDRDGVIHARNIFNKTTNSWVTKKPGPIDCFIATAVYGSSSANEVIIFKYFRDEFLSKNILGRILVNLYYYVSPPVATWIRKNKILKLIIRNILLRPFLKIIKSRLKLPELK